MRILWPRRRVTLWRRRTLHDLRLVWSLLLLLGWDALHWFRGLRYLRWDRTWRSCGPLGRSTLLALCSHLGLHLLQTHHLPRRGRRRHRAIALLPLVRAGLIGNCGRLLRWHTPQAGIDLKIRNVARVAVFFISTSGRLRRDPWQLWGSLSGLGHRMLSTISKLLLVDSVRHLCSLTEEVEILADLRSLSCCCCCPTCRWATKGFVVEGIIRLVQSIT
jgi:hypothetical protein